MKGISAVPGRCWIISIGGCVVAFPNKIGGMDVGDNVVFSLCSVKTVAAFVVAEDAGFNEVLIIGENDITVMLDAVGKDCPMLIFVSPEVPVRFTGDA